MRILIASTYGNLVGGAERYVQAVIPGLLERHHQIGLLHEYPCKPGLERVEPPNSGLPAWCPASSSIDEALRSIAAWQPDVVYLQGMDSLALEHALIQRYPTVLYAHNYYGTCISGGKCYTAPQTQPCTRTLGPACLFLFYPRRCGGLNPGTTWRMFQEQSARKSWFQHFRAILVASEHMRQEFERHGVSSDRLRLVPLPVDGSPGLTPPQPKIPRGCILFAGRLTNVKGGDFLVRAVPKAAERLKRSLNLVIAGDGPEREKLQHLAQRIGIKAEFTGWVNRDRKLNLMREADVLAVPSLWPEPFGLVGVEAGCVGVPAIAYAVGGIPAWLTPGESGELAPGDPPTVDGLADAIVRTLANSEHYNRLCLGAWTTAARFSLRKHLAQLEPILGSSPVATTTIQEGQSDEVSSSFRTG